MRGCISSSIADKTLIIHPNLHSKVRCQTDDTQVLTFNIVRRFTNPSAEV